jgi:hypothetical protein
MWCKTLGIIIGRGPRMEIVQNGTCKKDQYLPELRGEVPIPRAAPGIRLSTSNHSAGTITQLMITPLHV